MSTSRRVASCALFFLAALAAPQLSALAAPQLSALAAPAPAPPSPALGAGDEADEVSPRAAVAEVTCEACIVVDDRGRVLWQRHASRRLPNASTTKMATALRVVGDRDYDQDDVVVASPDAAATGSGGLDLHAGDAYTAGELLYALLLSSSNDASVALAEYFSGSEEAFVAGMNRLADRLGASSTRFVTPHGLDARGHYSTASDLAVVGAATLDDPVLAPIVATSRITLAGPRGPELVENRNLLLETYRGAIGVKTGFTGGAGNVLVGAATRHERRVVVVAMRSDDAAADARRLLDYGWHRLSRTVIVARGQTVGELVFDSGGSTLAVALRAVRGWARPEDVRLEFSPAASITAPVAPGEPVGEVELTGASGFVAAVAASATQPVPGDGSSWMQAAFATALRWGYETAAVAGVGEL